MKILFDDQVFSYQSGGGVSRYFFELAQGLEQGGDEAWLPFRHTPTQALQTWRPDRFRPFFPGLAFRGKAQLLEQLNRWASRRALKSRWDLFHPTYYDPYFLPTLKGRPFVLTIHDMTHERYPEGLKDAHLVPERKRTLAQAASAVIAVSEHTKADAVSQLGLSAEKIRVVPHGLSLSPEKVTPVPLALPERYILFVGHRHAYKNWAFWLRSLESLASKHPDLHIVCAGGGALGAEEQSLIRETSWRGRVVSFPFLKEGELATAYKNAAVFGFPSRYEGFGLPLLEAFAWDCPVTAARASSLPEVGGEAVLYFHPEDPREMLDITERALTDQGLRAELRRRGRERVREFSWAATVEKTRALYRSLI